MASTHDITMPDTIVVITDIASSPITAGTIAITAKSRTISIATTAIMRHSNSPTSMAPMGIAITAIVLMVMQARINSPAITATARMGITARTATIRKSRIMAIIGTVATATTLPIIATTAPDIAWPERTMARINSPIAVIMAKVLVDLRGIMSSLAGPITESAVTILAPLLMGMMATISSQASASTIGLLPDRTVIGGTVIGLTGIMPALQDRMPVRVLELVLALMIRGASRNSNEKLTTCFGWSPKYGKR